MTGLRSLEVAVGQSENYVPLDIIRVLQESLHLLTRIRPEDRKVALCGSRAEAPQDQTHDLDLMIPGHLPRDLREYFGYRVSEYLISEGYSSPDLMRLSDTWPEGSGFPISEEVIRRQHREGRFFQKGQTQVFIVEPESYHRVGLFENNLPHVRVNLAYYNF